MSLSPLIHPPVASVKPFLNLLLIPVRPRIASLAILAIISGIKVSPLVLHKKFV
jgi:hypothetical protein